MWAGGECAWPSIRSAVDLPPCRRSIGEHRESLHVTDVEAAHPCVRIAAQVATEDAQRSKGQEVRVHVLARPGRERTIVRDSEVCSRTCDVIGDPVGQ